MKQKQGAHLKWHPCYSTEHKLGSLEQPLSPEMCTLVDKRVRRNRNATEKHVGVRMNINIPADFFNFPNLDSSVIIDTTLRTA